MLISVAIPCYRSEHNLKAVVSEIVEEFHARKGYDYQIILVCDGSPDKTDQVIRKLCQEDPKITGVLLSRNFSQNNAKMAALPYVKGEVLVFMDDDGQHPPKDIFRLADKIYEGYDIVYATFEEVTQSKIRRWASNIFGNIAGRFNNRPKGIQISAFFAISRFAVEQLKEHKNPIPSVGGFLYDVTSKVVNIKSNQRKRFSGHSGYNFLKLISVTFQTLTNHSVIPIRIMDVMGSIFAIIGFIYGIVLFIRKLFIGSVIPGYTSNTVILLILGGLVLLSQGLIGEYIGRIYMLLSHKPQYVVRESINVQVEDGEKKQDHKM